MPAMAPRAARNSASGSKAFPSHSGQLDTGTLVTTLKSKQPPQTTRCTCTFVSASSLGRCVSNTFWAATRLALSLSLDHLQRHSLAMRLNLMPGHFSVISPLSGVGPAVRERRVYVWVSTWSIPSISLMASTNCASGSKASVSQPAKPFSGTLVITLKSWQPPQTTRCTCAPGMPHSMGMNSSSTLLASTRLEASEAALHLHRHSRAMRLNSTPGANSLSFLAGM
mmetsp:Transcript_31312/g.56273  ORF Transcript_31312/g.56273 Transcript_31312/m.56273 type:complete len:225 (-) Transcript_31312:30-704(-)